MGIRDYLSTSKPKIKWIENIYPAVPELCRESRIFYKKCLFNELTLVVGDYILVSNADSADPDTVSGCDVAKVLHLYELQEISTKDPYRAIVQWYSRPECLPHKEFDDDDICINFSCEVIEDHRSYDADISLETIFCKCKVILGTVSDSASALLQHANLNTDGHIFVCRYKFVKVKRSYKLVPLESMNGMNMDFLSNTAHSQTANNSTPKSKAIAESNVEFVDIDEISCKNKVSPIKIIGRKRIVRLPSHGSHTHGLKTDNHRPTIAEKSDCNNSKTMKDLNCHNNESHLRPLERRRSRRFVSFDDDPLNIPEKPEYIPQLQANRVGLSKNETQEFSDIYTTPKKKSKHTKIDMTPTSRRSILKYNDSPKGVQLKKMLASDGCCMKEGFRETNVDATITPSKRPINRHVTTPSNASNTFKSQLDAVRENLHVSAVPESLPCRENEFKNIYTFLEGKIEDQCGGCMYVAGVPGTGKTATVTGVIRLLQRKAAENHIQNFEYIEINAMRLTEPRQAYVQIYKQLTGKNLSWEHAHSRLEKRFTTPAPRRMTTVLLIDELDILCNRRQDVVYNILDWPTKSAARLVVVTIANTLDLPERLLLGKVTSRLGLTRLTFQPYTHKQLQEIVTARLGCKNEAFNSDAVQLVARKVAAVSGDARRALDICRRATEIANAAAINSDSDRKLAVNMIHVQQALSEMIASAKVQAIINCSRMEQLFLQAAVAEITRTGVEETSFIGVYMQMEAITAFLGSAMPSTGVMLKICSKLGSQHLIISEHSQNDIYQKIFLNVSMDDIHYALKVNNS